MCTVYFFHSDDTGGWSEEGVFLDVENTNSTTITCVTRHLTSFAVLVDTTGAADVSKIDIGDPTGTVLLHA